MSKPNTNSWHMGHSTGPVASNLRRWTITDCRCGEESVIHTVMDSANPIVEENFGDVEITRINLTKATVFLS